MKKIYYILLTMLAVCFTFVACNDEEPFSTATADDEPRILDPVFPDRDKGELPVISEISRDANFTMKLTVTPADHTTVTWQIDGYEIQNGTELDISLKAGTYHLKVIASTEAGKSTHREGIVKVNPLSDDPWATELGLERIIAPGTNARLYGNNLDKVRGIVIGGNTITDITYIESESGSYIEYVAPIDLEEGEHRVILVDANGNEFGGNVIKVYKTPLITSGAARTNASREWVMTGVNLDQVVSFTFSGQVIAEFVRQTSTEIAIICPALSDGEYSLTGKTKDGKDILFYNVKSITTEQTVTVSSEIILWEGRHYVSWELPDGNPNKAFNLIGKDVFATIKEGAILSIHYSVASQDAYHQLRTTTGWWGDLPGTEVIEFSEDGVKEVQLTQEVLSKIQSEDGFLCIGHGYYVDRITVQ